MLFLNTTIYKIFATESEKIIRQAAPIGEAIKLPTNVGSALTFETKCQKCGDLHKIYAKFVHDPAIDKELRNEGLKPFPKTNKLICQCGFEIDLSGLRNEIEARTGKKIIV